MDPATLRSLADATGGTFEDGSADVETLAGLHARHLAPLARKAFESALLLEREPRFQWPLLAAFALWMIELGLTDRRRPPR